jgi:dolichyl-phosphate beta-glucosyltransferase
VDDGSRDRTQEAVRAFHFEAGRMRFLRNQCNRGKGASIRRGMAAARGNVVLFTDADLSTPIQELESLEAALRQGADIAIASRGIVGSRVETHQPIYREYMGKIFNRFVQLLVLPGIHDTQCGFKLFQRTMARRIFRRLTIRRFGFDVEILYLARRLGARVAEVPVEWHNVLDSKVSPVKDALQMFLDLFRILLRHRKIN